ncbi:MAG: carboxypeptidase-like regulatory domain-containing protein [Limnohabitans sp.]|nr:carboxypeptidase-like regulatory domain-containing protein [Limnohabitans sp.]
MKSVKLISLAIVMFISLLSFTQQSNLNKQRELKIITGTVSEKGNGPLPGARVFVKRTKKYVFTDFRGRYSIEARRGDVIIFSFIGFDDFKIKIGELNEIHINLISNAKTLGI